MADIIGISAIFIIGALVIGLFIRHSRKQHEAWKTLARELGLEYSAELEGVAVRGTYLGHRVTLSPLVLRNGQQRMINIKTDLGATLPGGLRVVCEDRRIKHYLYEHRPTDMRVGDEPFDGRFVIRAEDQNAVWQVLTESVRVALTHFSHRVTNLRLEGDALEGNIKESFEPERIKDILDAQRQAVEAIGDRV